VLDMRVASARIVFRVLSILIAILQIIGLEKMVVKSRDVAYTRGSWYYACT